MSDWPPSEVATPEIRKATRKKIRVLLGSLGEDDDLTGVVSCMKLLHNASHSGMTYGEVASALQQMCWDEESALAWAKGLMWRKTPGAREMYYAIQFPPVSEYGWST